MGVRLPKAIHYLPVEVDGDDSPGGEVRRPLEGPPGIPGMLPPLDVATLAAAEANDGLLRGQRLDRNLETL